MRDSVTVCYRGHTELQTQLGAGDNSEERGPGVRLRGGVLLPAAHPGDDLPHPVRAVSLPLHRAGPHRPERPDCPRDLDRPRPLLLPPDIQPTEETRGLEVPLLHVRTATYHSSHN